jgi:UDP-2,3-diacylglucosamine pyrophosphatase LpxH
MSKQLAIILSDLHMGRGTPGDNFGGAGPTFRTLCEDVVTYSAENGVDTTVVLNGDVIDMWEMVPPEELGHVPGVDSAEAIRANLGYPATTAANRLTAMKWGTWQIESALNEHTDVVHGLASLIDAGSTVVYLNGNHDHAMMNTDLQAAFRYYFNQIARRTVATEESLVFDRYYRNETIGVYAEHGDEFAGPESRAPSQSWEEQALGFYVLRFIWNRLENNSESGESVGSLMKLVCLLIFRPNDKLSIKALGFLIDYFRAFDDGIVPALAPAPCDAFHTVYDRWIEQGRPEAADFDPSLVKDLPRCILAALGESPSAAWYGRAAGGSPIGLPGKPVPVPPPDMVWRDQFWAGLDGRLKASQAPFPRLSSSTDKSLFLGHTHNELQINMRSAQKACRYINTGSWANGRPIFGYATSPELSNHFLHSRGLLAL